MKPIFTIVTAFLLAMTISTSAFAHSHLTGTNPADGDVFTEPLTEIVLEFEGQIEQGSFIDVTTTDGQAVEVQDLIIGEGTLTGTLAEPLANAEYQVNWSIISADGHPLEGEFSFAVNSATSEPTEEETVEPSEGPDSAEQTPEDREEATSADEAEEESSSVSLLFIVLIVVIVAGGVFFLTKRKK
ncbi:MAG: copper resistance CopC family protein [Bacillota bacterium]